MAIELATGERLIGLLITIGLARKEGWYDKSGSEWQPMPELMLRYRAASWFVRACTPETAMGLKTIEEVQDTYVLEPTEDGIYCISMQGMKEGAQDGDIPSRRDHPTNAKIEARHGEVANVWPTTGNPIKGVEELVNACARSWTTVQCEKIKRLAVGAMRNGVQQDVPEVPAQLGTQSAPAASMITCPKTETQISDWMCFDCEQRAGRPVWAGWPPNRSAPSFRGVTTKTSPGASYPASKALTAYAAGNELTHPVFSSVHL